MTGWERCWTSKLRHKLWISVSLGLIASACGAEGGQIANVPPEFREACGRPGSEVRLVAPGGTIEADACDLTGVTLRWADGGALVPPAGQGVANSDGLSVRTAEDGDVTYLIETP